MSLDNPSCQYCGGEFTEMNEPHLLPDCGHSICFNCISYLLKSQEKVVCREDRIEAINKRSLNDFPKNYALLQIIAKRSQKFLRTSGHDQQKLQVADNYDGESSSTSEKNFHSGTPTEATKQIMVEEFIRKQLPPVSGDDLSDRYSSSTPPAERCIVHRKKNDILCLHCKVKVCSNCALFGGHKIHDVMPVDEAVQLISNRAQDLIDIYQEVQSAKMEILNEQLFHQMIREHLNEHSVELLEKVEAMFYELHEQLDRKKKRLQDDIRKRIYQMEEACFRHLKDLVFSTASKADLWCMTTQSKLNYFSEQTEKGEIPVDILSDTANGDVVQIGNQVLRELQIAKMDVISRMEQLAEKQLKVECKGGLDKILESMFNLVLRTPDQEHILQRESTNNSRQNSQTIKMESSGGVNVSFMRMVVGDQNEKMNDPFLLKDINNSSLFLDSQTQFQFQEAINMAQMVKSPKRVSFLNDELDSPLSQNRMSVKSMPDRNRKASPTPATKGRGVSKSKLSKLPEKFQLVITSLKNDTLEIADFTGADMGDEALIQLIPIVIISKKLRVLKLVKNKISDAGASQFLSSILQEQNKDQYSLPNNNLASVNMSNNMITEKIVDLLLDLTRKYVESMHVQSLRSIYLSQNLINSQKVKKKTDEMKKLGVNIQV